MLSDQRGGAISTDRQIKAAPANGTGPGPPSRHRPPRRQAAIIDAAVSSMRGPAAIASVSSAALTRLTNALILVVVFRRVPRCRGKLC
jgi:hypothetical protein